MIFSDNALSSSLSNHFGRRRRFIMSEPTSAVCGSSGNQYDPSVASFEELKQHYKARRMNELRTILDNPASWKEFQDLLRIRHSHCVTNTSVKEGLLSTLLQSSRMNHRRNTDFECGCIYDDIDESDRTNDDSIRSENDLAST